MVKKLTELLPGERIVYLGDTGRAPYGPRSPETIVKYAKQDAAFLAGFGIKAMVIACNTAASTAHHILEREYAVPVYEVIGAPAKVAVGLTRNGRIGVAGTAATVRSGAYESAIKAVSPELQVFSAACPVFVPLVEDGITGEDDPAALSIAGRYLSVLRDAGVDTLILGCTHYPLLRGVISSVMGAGVALVDSGAETARLVADDLRARDMLTRHDGAGGGARFYVTDCADSFTDLASRFLEADVRGLVEQTDITKDI
jgi:glutamate racemase